MNDNSDETLSEWDSLRLKWREVRDSRLLLKRELLKSGLEQSAVRKNREYRRLKKEQDRLSTLMKHIEKRLNKKRANFAKKETGS